jgi:hypothetical protein
VVVTFVFVVAFDVVVSVFLVVLDVLFFPAVASVFSADSAFAGVII